MAKVIAKNGISEAVPKTDVIVFAEQGFEVEVIKTADQLRRSGLVVENALFSDIEMVRSYAKEKKISKIVIIDGENENRTEVLS